MAASRMPLVFLVLVICTQLWCCGGYDYWEDDNTPLIYSRYVAQEIIDHIATLFTMSFPRNTMYSRGRVISRTFGTTAGNVVVRIFLYSRRGSIPYCQANPSAEDSVGGTSVRRGFRQLLADSTHQILASQAAWVYTENVLYGIEYYFSFVASKRPPPNVMPSSNPGYKQVVPGDEAECDVFSTSLHSGYKFMPSSYMHSQIRPIYSPLGNYMFRVTEDCFGVLESASQSIWRTDNQDRPGRPCVLQLQEDGNMVIYDGSEVAWATNTYCEPQPYCVEPSFVAMQDDCNLVLYRTLKAGTENPTPTAPWASNTYGCD